MTVVWRTECKAETPLLVKMLQTSKWCTCEKGSGQGDILVPCCPATIANPMNFSTLDQTQHQVLNLQWECTIYFCKPLSSLFLVFVLEICQFPRLVTSLELPCCFFWVELVLIHLYKIIGSLRHPKHFNIFGVAEVAVCLVVPWKLNVTYMERVMRLKNSIVTYPSFQE